MEITKLTEDVSQVSKLGTYPRTENGLSSDQLKAWFDKAPDIIKTYLNETLIPEVEAKFGSLDAWIAEADTKIDSFITGTGFLPTAGGTMEGPINMGSQKITSLAVPASNGDAANKQYVDEEIADAATQTTSQAKTYTDGRDALYAVTLTASGWSNKYQTVAVATSTTDKTKTAIFASPDPSNANGYAAYLECGVRMSQQTNGYVTFYCAEDTPTVNIPVSVYVKKVV